MTLATPARSRRRAIPTRDLVPITAVDARFDPMPVSALDRALGRLSEDHPAHTSGPVMPCPECFQPALVQSRRGPVSPVA